MYYNVRSEADRQIELSSSDKMENMKGCKRLRVYTIVDISFIRTFAPSF